MSKFLSTNMTQSPRRRAVMRGVSLVGAGALALAVAGCGPRSETVISLARVSEIKRGISSAELELACGRFALQFQAERMGVEYSCVSYAVTRRYLTLYFLFADDRLVAISEPPPFEYETVPWRNGSRYGYRKPGYADTRIATVLAAEDLSNAAIEASVRRRSPRTKSASLNALPAFLLLVLPFQIVMSPITAIRCHQHRALVEHYDPLRISIGMTKDEVDAIFGEPTRTRSSDSGALRVYGKSGYPRTWTAVRFRNGRASEIYSGDFFDRSWMVPVPPRMSGLDDVGATEAYAGVLLDG